LSYFPALFWGQLVGSGYSALFAAKVTEGYGMRVFAVIRLVWLIRGLLYYKRSQLVKVFGCLVVA
jgi:hypothetical protein